MSLVLSNMQTGLGFFAYPVHAIPMRSCSRAMPKASAPTAWQRAGARSALARNSAARACMICGIQPPAMLSCRVSNLPLMGKLLGPGMFARRWAMPILPMGVCALYRPRQDYADHRTNDRSPLLAGWESEKATIAAERTRRRRCECNNAGSRRMGCCVLSRRLRGFTALDPACGAGNFLYLALHALNDIEHRVQLEAGAIGLQHAFVPSARLSCEHCLIDDRRHPCHEVKRRGGDVANRVAVTGGCSRSWILSGPRAPLRRANRSGAPHSHRIPFAPPRAPPEWLHRPQPTEAGGI